MIAQYAGVKITIFTKVHSKIVLNLFFWHCNKFILRTKSEFCRRIHFFLSKEVKNGLTDNCFMQFLMKEIQKRNPKYWIVREISNFDSKHIDYNAKKLIFEDLSMYRSVF